MSCSPFLIEANAAFEQVGGNTGTHASQEAKKMIFRSLLE
jgi:hypothetical protein